MEIHIIGVKTSNIMKMFKFGDVYISEGEGFSIGIWCLWKSTIWNMNVVKIHKQFIHLKVSLIS